MKMLSVSFGSSKLTVIWGLIAAVLSSAAVSQVGFAQTCEGSHARDAVRISAQPYAPGYGPGDYPEAFGRTPFLQSVGENRTFALLPQENGWSFGIYSAPYSPDAVDLSAITSQRNGKNPREILATDFLAEGDRALKDRLFLFSDILRDTGGYRPPRESQYVPTQKDGLGWLKILDHGLSDVGNGRAPRLTYLKFDACLTWPKSEDEIEREMDFSSPLYLDSEIETFGGCGLDLAKYELRAAILPRLISGDFDGDGALDEAAQIRRRVDGQRGLAICRAGTLLDIAGLQIESMGPSMRSGYVGEMEAWQVLDKNKGKLRFIGEDKWPRGDGDTLALERIERELVLLFYNSRILQSYQAYHIVEP